MIEKILHGGNFAACFGAIATTAADLGICGGTATGISALLSAHAVIKRDKTLTPLAHQMGQAFEAAVKASPLPADTKKLIPQLMAKFPVSEEDIAKGILEPAQVAAIIRARIENAREKGTEDPALTGAALVNAYEAILTQMLTPVLAAPVGMEPMQWAINRQMLAQSAITGATKRLFEEGVTEKAIIGLAQKIAAETNDIGQAWAELQNAMEMAVRVQADGRVASNHGDFVDEVLHRVAALSADGEYKSAGDEIDAALAREEQEAQARKVKLLDRGVEVALLDRDTKRAADLLVRKADAEAGGHADDTVFAQLQLQHNRDGENKGLLRAELAIDLGRLLVERYADTPNSMAFEFRLANSLFLASNISGHHGLLDEAIQLYRAMIEKIDRKTSQVNWARFHNNLGASLRLAGDRNKDGAQLRAAIGAFENALEEQPREDNPAEWSETQNNLGATLQRLGELEGKQEHLRDAIKIFKLSIEEQDLIERPAAWANAYINLASATLQLASQEDDLDGLLEAISHSRVLTSKLDPKRAPRGWATAQMNLGTMLRNVAEKTRDVTKLEEAISALEAASEQHSQERMPIQWANTQIGLGSVHLRHGEWLNDRKKILNGIECYKSAGEIYRRNHVQSHWVTAEMNLGIAYMKLAKIDGDYAALEKAETTLVETRKKEDRKAAPMSWATINANLVDIYLEMFDLDRSAAALDKAEASAKSARDIFEKAQAKRHLEYVQTRVERIVELRKTI